VRSDTPNFSESFVWLIVTTPGRTLTVRRKDKSSR
jgi:hypothetical protein